jgi:hypothetical protein
MSGYDYYKNQNDFVLDGIQIEIDFLQDNDGNIYFPDYLEYLKSRIGKGTIDPSKQRFIPQTQPTIERNNMNDYTNELSVMVYGKPWVRIREYHKIMKINEYTNGLTYKRKLPVVEKNRKHVFDNIVNGLKAKMFGKNKHLIDYDETKMKILSIDCITYDEKKDLYKVIW